MLYMLQTKIKFFLKIQLTTVPINKTKIISFSSLSTGYESLGWWQMMVMDDGGHRP